MTEHRLWVGVRVSLAVAAVSTVAAVVSVVAVLAESEPYDPFGEFPLQLVAGAERNGDGVPVVPLSTHRTVTIEGQKCYDEAVTIRGEIRFQFIEPVGGSVVFSEGETMRLPGCTFWLVDLDQCPATAARCFRAYRNDLAPIADRVADLYADSAGPVVVKVSGFETPVDGGARQTFSSEEFIITP